MIVTSLKHGKAVVKRLLSRMEKEKKFYFISDTETQAKPGFDGAKDAVVIGRMQIKVISVCYMGESYSFPTSIFSPNYPLAFEWLEIFAPIFDDPRIYKVNHYSNYDLNVFTTEGLRKPIKKIWCTMIGAWKACAAVEKGLKSRAPLYGRHLRKTTNVDFSNLRELSEYAEEDVVLTDELYQMQMYGYFVRPHSIHYLKSDGTFLVARNTMPVGRFVIKDEDLNGRERAEIKYQELPYLKANIRSEQRGFPFNTELLADIRKKIAQDKDESLKRVFKMAGRTLNIASSKQLGELLNELGIKSIKKTKTGGDSYDSKSLFFIQDQHPIIPQIQEYKRKSTLQNFIGDVNAKKTEKKLGLAYFVAKDGRIRATANTVGAVTGRGTSSNPNLTQIPAAKDYYGIKRCFVPPKGQLLICLDYAQLELRVSALLHQDRAMSRILCDPEGDLHTYTAEEFSVDRDPTAKQINFLLVYGGGAYVLSEKLTTEGVPTDAHSADALINRYNQVYSDVQPWRKELLRFHEEHGFVRLFTGRHRALKHVNWGDKREVHKAETTLANNVVQGSGQDFLKAAIIRSDPACYNPDKVYPMKRNCPPKHRAILKDQGRKLEKYRREFKLAKCKWILQVHDESIWFADKSAAVDIANKLAEIMTWRHFIPPILPYSVPLVADGGVADNWKAAKAKDNPNRVHAGI